MMAREPKAGTTTAEAARDLPGRARTSLRQVLWGLVLAISLPIILVTAGGI